MLQQDQFTKICFYIVAHADDWQLFMCPNVYNDILGPGTKVVFIITTAGDAGKQENYWKAREEGAKSSLRFCIAPLGNFPESNGIKRFNGHNISYWCARNSIFYFLLLPDGNIDGKGFSAYHFQSLSKLKSGEIKCITAVDDSVTYNGWNDIYTTIEAIIVEESGSVFERWINYINPDEIINLNDHADHIATGEAIQLTNVINKSYQTLFNGYSVSSCSNPLNGNDLFWKIGMFAAYDKAVFDHSNYSTLKEGLNTYINWCFSGSRYVVIKPK